MICESDLEKAAELHAQRIKNAKGHLEHIACDGARFHVISYVGTRTGAKRICSEPDCEVNFEQE